MSTQFEEAGVRACQDMWDKGMNEVDAELIGSLFAENGELMLENSESILGRAAITEVATAGFEANNRTGWSERYCAIEVHGRSASVIGDFDFEVHLYDERPSVRHLGRGSGSGDRVSTVSGRSVTR